jgi:hypothetical protein
LLPGSAATAALLGTMGRARCNTHVHTGIGLAGAAGPGLWGAAAQGACDAAAAADLPCRAAQQAATDTAALLGSMCQASMPAMQEVQPAAATGRHAACTATMQLSGQQLLACHLVVQPQ